MTGGYFDPEAIEQERYDTDCEQAELEMVGREYARRGKRSARLRALGDLAAAAACCPHGGGYPLRSPAARAEQDPRSGEEGVRCFDCGSVLTDWPYDGGVVLYPCESWPGRGRA